MKISLTKRLTIDRIWIYLGAALLAIAALLVGVAFLSPRFTLPDRASTSSIGSTPAEASGTVPSVTATPENAPTTVSSDAATPTLSPTAGPPAASVNGHVITQSYLSQTIRLNAVLGELSGASSMNEEETLQRLIMSELILQGVADIEEPTQEDVESFIAGLEGSWGINDETLVQMLRDVGLERAFFEDTIARLLTVDAGAQQLEDEGHMISEWLTEQEQDADITVFEGAAGAEEGEASPTTPRPAQTDTPAPVSGFQPEVPDVAPDFTLSRAGGGSFTLADQLERGPVVLVFFEKCG